MDHAVKKIILLEKAKNDLAYDRGVTDPTPEQLYYALCGLQDERLREQDPDTADEDESHSWFAAFRSVIHDQLNEMENA